MSEEAERNINATGRTRIDRVLLVCVLILQLLIIAVAGYFFFKRPDSSLSLHAKPSAVPADARPGNEVGPADLFSFAHQRKVPLPMPNVADSHGAMIHEEMEQFMDDAFHDLERMQKFARMMDQGWDMISVSPAMDMREQSDNYVVVLGMPGVNPEDVEVGLSGRMLTVSTLVQHDDKNSHSVARREARFLLPGPVGNTNCACLFTNGILKITVAKK